MTRKKHGGARTGAGRPRKPSSRRRVLQVAVSPLAEAAIRQAADTEHVSVSEWLWRAVVAHYGRTVALSD